MKLTLKNIILSGLAIGFFNHPIMAQNGEALYKQNCAACHRIDKKRMVGPGLEGINQKRTEEWLISWIKNSQNLIKSGDADAVAIYEEYNKVMMTPFEHLTDAELKAILSYIPGEAAPATAGVAEQVPAEPEQPIVYTPEEAELGKLLFTGAKAFKNGGQSCISCHNVTNDAVIAGGLLAKDLTNVYSRMGDAGISGIVSAPPFPAMASAYGNNAITEEEVKQLNAFFKFSDETSATQQRSMGYDILIVGGIIGLVTWLIIIAIIWNKRKREMVKKDIFKRQLRGKDSIVY